MKKIIILGLLITLSSFCEANAQLSSTKIARIEIDGKEFKKEYKVFFLWNGKWTESEKTSTGFIVPSALRTEEYLAVLVTFGKYRLEFSKIHISKFDNDWIVGIDKKPFSDEYVKPEEANTTKRAYYIEFHGSYIDTLLVVAEKTPK